MADDDNDAGTEGQGQDEGAVTRTEFEGLEGKVDRVLSMLEGGKGPAKDGGKDVPGDIGAQVRAGIEELEAKKRADEAAAADKADRDSLKARVDKLEEVPPGEPDSIVDRMRRRIYGTERDGSATPRRQKVPR